MASGLHASCACKGSSAVHDCDNACKVGGLGKGTGLPPSSDQAPAAPLAAARWQRHATRRALGPAGGAARGGRDRDGTPGLAGAAAVLRPGVLWYRHELLDPAAYAGTERGPASGGQLRTWLGPGRRAGRRAARWRLCVLCVLRALLTLHLLVPTAALSCSAYLLQSWPMLAVPTWLAAGVTTMWAAWAAALLSLHMAWRRSWPCPPSLRWSGPAPSCGRAPGSAAAHLGARRGNYYLLLDACWLPFSMSHPRA